MNSKKQRSHISIQILKIGMLGIGIIILMRLFQLQVLQYDQYSPQSKENALRQEFVSPARGLIFDRNGELLVDNEPIYSITITPTAYDSTNTPLLANLLNMPVDDLKNRIQKAQNYSWQRPSRLISEINFDTFSAIEENLWKLPGISHQIESKRHYPVDSLRASHIFGYLREVSEEEYRQSDTYRLGEKIGKSGLESSFNNQLTGQEGTQYTLVNAMGHSLGSYNNGSTDKAPTKGSNLHTTLSTDLQLLAEDLMQGKRGAAVAIDVNTGGILSMVSAPQFDIRKLSGSIDENYWQSIQQNTENPLFNRAILSEQPPGSTFKPLMALIGLKMDIITPQTTVYNPGYYLRGRRYGDHADKGTYDLTSAIQHSSNTYFFQLMDKIATSGRLDQWHDMAADFGLGTKPGVDLPYQANGILPDSAYFNRVIGENKWGIGDVINLGVGQGHISTSPLQMALLTAEIANDGYRLQPHIIRSVEAENGQSISTAIKKEKIGWIEQEDIDVVKQGMRQVVRDGSSRYYTNLDSVKVAGKTGTAQNPHGEDHGWFIAFAPYENPQIAVAVLLENSGFGSISAAPLASLLIEQYLTGAVNRSHVYEYVKKFKPQNTSAQDE